MESQINRAVFLGLLTLVIAGCKRHPTDASLKMSFQKNSTPLSNIVGELKVHPDIERLDWVNGVIVVNGSETNPPSITGKLLPQLKSIGPRSLITNSRDGSQVWFYFSLRGLSVSGSAKGIAYQESNPSRLVKDTDTSSPTNAPFTVFSPIQSNWFIFYSR